MDAQTIRNGDSKFVASAPSRRPTPSRRDVLSVDDITVHPLAAHFPERSTTQDMSDLFTRAGWTLDYRFQWQFFLSELHIVREPPAGAVVDPVAMCALRRTCGGDGGIAFLPFESRLTCDVGTLVPKRRPASEVARCLEARLTEALAQLESGGARIGPSGVNFGASWAAGPSG